MKIAFIVLIVVSISIFIMGYGYHFHGDGRYTIQVPLSQLPKSNNIRFLECHNVIDHEFLSIVPINDQLKSATPLQVTGDMIELEASTWESGNYFTSSKGHTAGFILYCIDDESVFITILSIDRIDKNSYKLTEFRPN